MGPATRAYDLSELRNQVQPSLTKLSHKSLHGQSFESVARQALDQAHNMVRFSQSFETEVVVIFIRYISKQVHGVKTEKEENATFDNRKDDSMNAGCDVTKAIG